MKTNNRFISKPTLLIRATFVVLISMSAFGCSEDDVVMQDQVTIESVASSYPPGTDELVSGNTYKFLNFNAGGKYLAVSSGSAGDGANVILWDDIGQSDIKWTAKKFSSGWRFINKNSGKALGISSSAVGNGGNAVQWTSNGNSDQRWSAVKADLNNNGIESYRLVNKNSHKRLEASGRGTSNGTNVQQWENAGSDDYHQYWILVKQ